MDGSDGVGSFMSVRPNYFGYDFGPSLVVVGEYQGDGGYDDHGWKRSFCRTSLWIVPE